MERTVIIHGQVDTGNSVAELEELDKKLGDVKESSQELSEVEKKFKDLNEKIKSGGASMAEMKKAVKEYQNIALQAGEDSPIGQEAIRNAAELRDRLGDLNAQINANAHDGANMQAALQLGSTIVSGYTAFQGVTAMLGVENEELLETLTKLQAATSTLQAIEQVRAALEKESFLMIKARAIATNVMTGAQWALNAAMAANPIGLIIAGLVALGVGIAAIVTKFKVFGDAWDLLKQGVAAAVEGFKMAYEWIVETASAMLEWVTNSKAARIALGILTFGMSELYIAGANLVKSYYDQKKAADAAAEAERKRQEELRKRSQAATEAAMAEIKAMEEAEKMAKKRHATEIEGIDFEIAKRNAAGQQVADLERKKLKMVIERARQELEFEQKKNDRLRELVEEQARIYGVSQEQILAQYKKSGIEVDKIRENRMKAEEEAAERLKKAEQSLQLFNISEAKKGADKRKALDDLRLEEQRALEDLMVANIKDSTERQLAEIKLRHSREREEIIKKYGENSKLLAELEKKQGTELEELKKSIDDERTKKQQERDQREAIAAAELKVMQARENFELEIEAQKELAALQRDQALADDQLTNSERLKIQEEYNQEVEALDKELVEARAAQKQMERDALMTIGESTISGLRSLGEIAIKDGQKAAKFNAWLTAAQMALDTAKAISSVVAGATAAAAAGGPAAPFLIAGYIASGLATVLANIATAKKAFDQAKLGSAPSVPTGTSGSGGGGSSGSDFVTRGRTQGQSTEDFIKPEPQEVVILQSELERSNKESQYIKTRSTI